MVGKNFKNSVSIEKYLYSVSQDLKAGKITAAEANAASHIASQWLKAHEQRQQNEILQRLSGLESAMKQKAEVK